MLSGPSVLSQPRPTSSGARTGWRRGAAGPEDLPEEVPEEGPVEGPDEGVVLTRGFSPLTPVDRQSAKRAWGDRRRVTVRLTDGGPQTC